MFRAHVTITGTSPILLNPATDELLADLEGAVKKGKSARLTNEQKSQKIIDFLNQKYGGLGLPARYVVSNLVNAGKKVQYAGVSKLTDSKKATMIFNILEIHQPSSRFFAFDPCSDPVLDVVKGVNPNGGEAVVIARPRIDTWGFSYDITVHDDAILPPVKFQELMHIAGTGFGFGDWRPQKGGDHGMFNAVIEVTHKEKGQSNPVVLIDNIPDPTPAAKPSGRAKTGTSSEGELVGAAAGSNGNGSQA